MKHIVYNIWFRLIAPLLTGIIIYLLVLMFFDSLNQLTANFFGTELVLSILLAYGIYFVLRQFTVLWETLIPFEVNSTKRIIIQLIAGVFVACLIVWGIISLYFIYYLGYSKYMREASIFMALFSVMSLVYNSIFFSVIYLNKQNTEAVEREQEMNKHLLNDFGSLLRDTRPELFDLGMEALIIQLHKNKKQADKFISVFSNIYRYNIHSKRNELVSLSEELANLNNLLLILNTKYENNIKLETKLKSEDNSFHILPVSLQILTEVSVFSSIIGAESPLTITIEINQHKELLFKHNGIESVGETPLQNDLNYLSYSQKYFSGKPLKKECNSQETFYRLPLISQEIESLE